MIQHHRGYSTKISLPIHEYTSPHKIPEAQKRYPFWATPPSIGLSREYPPPPHLHPSPFYNMNILVLPFT